MRTIALVCGRLESLSKKRPWNHSYHLYTINQSAQVQQKIDLIWLTVLSEKQ